MDHSRRSVSSRLVAESVDIDNNVTNFPQGASFSPDGLCILTTTVEDHRLRLYNTPSLPPLSLAASPPSAQHNDDDANDDNMDGAESKSSPRHHVPLSAVLSCPNGDVVRSYAWYPHMNSSDPASCCFLATSRDQPIHLWDAYTGLVRATYRPYNALDEMESPTVVTFSPDGQRVLAAGFRTDRTIHCFDTSIPGRDSTMFRLGKTRKSRDGQKGLVSAMAFHHHSSTISNGPHVMAVGTYAPGSIYIYDDRSGTAPTGVIWTGLCVAGHGASFARKTKRNVQQQHQTTPTTPLKRSAPSNDDDPHVDDDDNKDDTTNANQHEQQDELVVRLDSNMFAAAKRQWYQSRARRGITQLSFGPDWILYSASRQSDAILAWDVRCLSSGQQTDHHAVLPVGGLTSFATDAHTNQRLQFDLTTTTNNSSDGTDNNENLLLVSGRDHCVRIYQLSTGNLYGRIDMKQDIVVNGVSCTTGPGGQTLVAVTTGARQFPSEDDLDLDVIPLSGSINSTAATTAIGGSLQIYELKHKVCGSVM